MVSNENLKVNAFQNSSNTRLYLPRLNFYQFNIFPGNYDLIVTNMYMNNDDTSIHSENSAC